MEELLVGLAVVHENPRMCLGSSQCSEELAVLISVKACC